MMLHALSKGVAQNADMITFWKGKGCALALEKLTKRSAIERKRSMGECLWDENKVSKTRPIQLMIL